MYKWRHGDASPQHARRVRLGIEVGRLSAAHKGRYGAPRITADLREAGERVSENWASLNDKLSVASAWCR